MNALVQRLNDLAHRHQHVVFDLRGNCRVLYGIAVAHPPAGDPGENALSVISDALEQDGMISVSRDPSSGAITFMRCRLFTATEQAMRFAHTLGQTVIHNLNRSCDVHGPFRGPTERTFLEVGAQTR